MAELERFAGEDSSHKDEKNGPEKVTVVARRILPALRHYSSWLLTISNLLVAQKEEKETLLSVQIKEFWKIYANTLTLLASTFDVVHLPEIDYLLEEDEETLGFAPLAKEATNRRYLDTNGKQKPRMNDSGVQRNHPSIEMLYRIREFVIDGLDLVVSNVREKKGSLLLTCCKKLTKNCIRKSPLLSLTIKIKRHSSTRRKDCLLNSSPAPTPISIHFQQPVLSERTYNRLHGIPVTSRILEACSVVLSRQRPLWLQICIALLRV